MTSIAVFAQAMPLCWARKGKYMSFTEDRLLAIWEAMNLIERAQECSNIADIPEILAEAEMVLSHVLKDLVHSTNNISASAELPS
jgi:hypothetical protein